MKTIVTDPWARDYVARNVLEERWKQDQKWGEQNYSDGTGGAMAAHEAEVAKEWTDARFRAGLGTWKDILNEEVREAYAESDQFKLRTELVQVAAVAMAWIECIDRRNVSAGKKICDELDSRSTSHVASGAKSEDQPRQGSECGVTPMTAVLSVASDGTRKQDVAGLDLSFTSSMLCVCGQELTRSNGDYGNEIRFFCLNMRCDENGGPEIIEKCKTK